MHLLGKILQSKYPSYNSLEERQELKPNLHLENKPWEPKKHIFIFNKMFIFYLVFFKISRMYNIHIYTINKFKL